MHIKTFSRFGLTSDQKSFDLESFSPAATCNRLKTLRKILQLWPGSRLQPVFKIFPQFFMHQNFQLKLFKTLNLKQTVDNWFYTNFADEKNE